MEGVNLNIKMDSHDLFNNVPPFKSWPAKGKRRVVEQYVYVKSAKAWICFTSDNFSQIWQTPFCECNCAVFFNATRRVIC